MVATAPQEVSVEQFREGLFRLSGENQAQADQLFETFKEALIEDIALSVNAKKKGKAEAQILFERMKAREGRKHYKKLRRNLGAKPANTAGHHIVSWYYEGAKAAREILRKFGIDIDSAANGVYLPRFKKHVPHKDIPNAHPHSVVHTDQYYINITTLLRGEASIPGTTKEDIEVALAEISEELKNGTFPLKELITED